MAIDLNTVPEGGEELTDLNKKPDEHEEDHNPFEDVVDAIEVGGSGRFGLHPDQIHEQAEIHQGKHVCLYPNLSVLFQALSLSLTHTPSPSPSPSPKISVLVYFCPKNHK